MFKAKQAVFCDIFRNGSLVIENNLRYENSHATERSCFVQWTEYIIGIEWDAACRSAGWSQRICALFSGNEDKKQRLGKIIVSSTAQTQGKTLTGAETWLYKNQGSRTEESLHKIKIYGAFLNDEACCVLLFFALRVLLDTSKRHKRNGQERNS